MGGAKLVALIAVGLLTAVGCDDATVGGAATTSPTVAPSTASPTPESATSVDSRRPAMRRETVTYTDVAGRDRSVFIEIRLPATQPPDESLPVLIWSHGGVGRTTPVRVGKEWGDVASTAGWAVVAIAHPMRTDAEWTDLCTAAGAASCEEFNPMRWDRPADLTAVIDWLETYPDDAGGLDLERIVYGGHSAGGFAVMITAGAQWPYASELAPPADPRPIGFIVASPPGVEARGFVSDSFDDLRGPLLFVSGDGDTTSGSPASERRKMLELLPATIDAVSVWVGDADTRHTTFDLDPKSCRRAGGTNRRCNEIVTTLGHVGASFLDMLEGRVDVDHQRLASMIADRAPAYLEVATPG